VSKPSIVFAHGIWADGSCFQKLIPTLRAEGHEVMAAQYGLDTLKGDVDATVRTFGRVSGPIVLVGHSYGGTVITHAGMDPRVAALVYIAALGPDETETSSTIVCVASAVSGVFSDGFHTTGSPQTKARAAFQDQTATGKLKAEMTPQTPSGCQVSIIRWSARSVAMVRP
jgi:pimeloyl-ACP methyl ester carboxylesterase